MLTHKVSRNLCTVLPIEFAAREQVQRTGALFSRALFTKSLILRAPPAILDEACFEAPPSQCVSSGLCGLKEPELRQNDYRARSLKYMAKDLRLAVETTQLLRLRQTEHSKKSLHLKTMSI